ncbi:MAG TPA: metalloregulator ArsR/SmtB family transcription factor [Patescibacteria group bacterium]|nr:metalloregulator ArsR/SmtB family transcription factor [Patescibacteria group bacterium]
MDRTEIVLRAVANSRRLAMVRELKRRQATVGDLAAMLRLSFPATSSHLRILRSAGLVERRQRGLEMYYRIADDQSRFIKRLLAII